MASRKTTPASSARKAPSKPAADRREAAATTAVSSTNPNRLLREAAWSAMFGRVESKNPFTR